VEALRGDGLRNLRIFHPAPDVLETRNIGAQQDVQVPFPRRGEAELTSPSDLDGRQASSREDDVALVSGRWGSRLLTSALHTTMCSRVCQCLDLPVRVDAEVLHLDRHRTCSRRSPQLRHATGRTVRLGIVP
jgi:hypothetical protein